MFKNIFTNYINRLVYQQKGSEKSDVQAEEAVASPEDLRAEAEAINMAINKFSLVIEDGINSNRTIFHEQLDPESLKLIKIDLNNPDSYAELMEDDRNLWTVIESLADAQKILKQGNTRGDLDFVRAKISATNTFFKGLMNVHPYKSDPSLGLMTLASIDLDTIHKAQPATPTAKEKKESIESSKWTRMASLADEYNKLGETADDKARKLAIQGDLLALTGEVMKGKPDLFVMTNIDLNGQLWNLKVERAKGPGTEAFRLTMKMPTKTLMMGGLPDARTVKYTEKPVYAGASETDFPKA